MSTTPVAPPLPGDLTADRSPAVANDAIPSLIKRNTALLAASQAIVGMGNQMVPTLTAIMIEQMLHSALLSGLGFSALGASRFIVAYPLGRFSDRRGRRPAILLGLSVGLVGALLLAGAQVLQSFPLFVVAVMVFGAGVGAAQQFRLGAADMFPPHRRAEGLGLVLTGSLVGAAGGPVLISIAQGIAPNLGMDAIAASWVIVPFLLIPTMILIWFVRPDPKEIAANLSAYYPNLPAIARSQPMAAVGFRAYWAEPAKRIAFSANALAQGNMAMMMAMTPISLSHHGHGLTEISIAVAIHVMGMFAFSLPLGRLSDRIGRKPLLIGGVIVAGAGSVVVPLTPDYWVATLGIFLVGLGWSGVNVAGSAVIADTTNAAQRGRAIGANDTFVGAAGVAFPLIGGALVALAGLPALSVFAVLVLAPVAVMILGLKETRPER